jgi:uncharacterized membrane protein
MLTFQVTLYLLAVVTSLACTVFLFRAYLENRLRLLLWSALCFVGLSVNNIAVFFDLVVFPDLDLRPLRLGATLVGMLFLLYGFIWESE